MPRRAVALLAVSQLTRASHVVGARRCIPTALRLIEIPWGAAADLGNERAASCPIVLWIVGVAAWDLDGLLARLGLSRSSYELAEYHSAYVMFRKHP
jgi:hypothetical protein